LLVPLQLVLSQFFVAERGSMTLVGTSIGRLLNNLV
jgi:hypothetical protein